MKELISLVNVISSQKTQKIDLFSSKLKLPYKSRKLYDGILAKKIISEEDAISHLYDSEIDSPKFNKLKNRLKKRLLNTLFFLDLSKDEFTDLRKATHEINKDYILVKLLQDRRQERIAINIAKKSFKKAVKFHLTEEALLLGKKLLDHYSVVQPIKKKRDYFEQQVEILNNESQAELIAKKYINRVSFLYITKKSKFSKTDLEDMKKYTLELQALQLTHKGYTFNRLAYNLITSYYTIANELEKSISICEEALIFFDGIPFENIYAKWSIRNTLILSAIPQKKYDLARAYSDQNFEVLTRGTYNWFYQSNFLYLILAAQHKYQELYNLILDVTSAKNYKQFILQNEYWKVIEAYAQFLIRLEKIDPELNKTDKKLKPFSLSKFLNEVPKFSKDKRGINISILIIQFLFLLVDKKYGKIIDRIDAIKQYSYRYLKDDETYRSNLFIKMLIKVVNVDFHPIAVQRHTKDLQAKLLSSKPSANFQTSEIEVIQYEKLWELIVELLEKNKND